MKNHIYQEITEWSTETPNHIYIFEVKPSGRSAKAVAYVAQGTDRVQKFKSPMVLDLKGRSFKELDR